MALTGRETTELARLLKKLGGSSWFAEEVFYSLHGVVSMWAPELIIVRQHGNEKQILLAPYDGIFKKGHWHIPGGYNLRDETMQQSCSRIAKRELEFDVRVQKIMDAYKWTAQEHPYGRPLSLYVLCRPARRIKENSRMKFFPVRRLPKKMMPAHRRFIEKSLW